MSNASDWFVLRVEQTVGKRLPAECRKWPPGAFPVILPQPANPQIRHFRCVFWSLWHVRGPSFDIPDRFELFTCRRTRADRMSRWNRNIISKCCFRSWLLGCLPATVGQCGSSHATNSPFRMQVLTDNACMGLIFRYPRQVWIVYE